MAGDQPILGSLYVYAPNKVAPIFFAAAFAVSAVGHIWQCFLYKSFQLIGLHPFCAVLFSAGYAMREYGAFNYLYSSKNLLIYVLSQVFIYICPPLLELTNYHVLGRIFSYVPYLAPLPPDKVLSTFGALVSLVEVLNSLGVAFASNPSSTHSHQELGSHLTIAALSIQIAVILTFVLLAAIFHRRCIRANIHSRAVSTPLITMYMSMLLILARCIYRLVEHLGSTTVQLNNLAALMALDPILRHEWFFYVFEASLMLINSLLWNVWNPGRFLPTNHRVHLARDGVREVEGHDEPNSRPVWAIVLMVLTFGLLGRKTEPSPPFQELTDYPTATAPTGLAKSDAGRSQPATHLSTRGNQHYPST